MPPVRPNNYRYESTDYIHPLTTFGSSVHPGWGQTIPLKPEDVLPRLPSPERHPPTNPDGTWWERRTLGQKRAISWGLGTTVGLGVLAAIVTPIAVNAVHKANQAHCLKFPTTCLPPTPPPSTTVGFNDSFPG